MKLRKKYMPSWGIAFAEHREMRKLGRMAASGWHLESFAFLGYWLRKGEPKPTTYCVDYRKVDPAEQDDYLSMFEAGGWRLAASAGTIHIFAANPGTPPIYTDDETKRVKYGNALRWLRPALAIPLLTLVLFAWQALRDGEAGVWDERIRLAGTFGLSLSVPILMMAVVYALRWRRTKR